MSGSAHNWFVRAAHRHRLTNMTRFCHCLLLLCVLSASSILPTKAAPFPPGPDLPVTNGLIRWWPNLFDARDEITGQEGVVMGLLPPVSSDVEDTTEFA